MREIKFRAWFSSVKHKKMVYNLGFDDDSFRKLEDADDMPCVWDRDEIINEDRYDATFSFEIMQYVGWKDKNEKEIYEGDIVRCITPDGEEYKSTITYNGGAFTVEVMNSDYDYTALGWALEQDIDEIEVIGNIYEHPKMI